MSTGNALGRLSRGATPTLGDAALHGLAGDIVRALTPRTEASASAMLVSLLAAFCAMVGRGVATYGGKPQHARLFTLIVGATARARKGTSLSVVTPILRVAGEISGVPFEELRCDGLSTGEGLIAAAANGPDRQILVVEEEFGRTLGVMNRDGNTLSAVLRSAWDGTPLAVLTRSDPLRLEDAHVNLIGHVTMAELDEKLRGSDVHNGMANRLLIVLSERSHLLPQPSPMPDDEVCAFGERLGHAVRTARRLGHVRRSEAFEALWEPMYYELEGRPSGGSAFDSLTARSSSHVVALALVYALIDGSATIEPPHLAAAASLWEYSEATIAHVWGYQLSDARLNKVMQALRRSPEGLSRSAINRLFSNNLAGEEVDWIFERMASLGLAEERQEQTGGRSRRVLRLSAG